MRRLIPLALLALAACASPKLVGGQDLQLVQASELPSPSALDTTAADRPYLIGSFDKLSVDVFQVPDLTREVQVDASGRISVPLAGEIEAAGKTPEQLAAVIEGRLVQYIRNPEVAVNVVETISQIVTIDGEVTKPGLYPVYGDMTLMRAVATAGGITPFAKRDHVVVFRKVEGNQYAALYDLNAIRQGLYGDPEIFGNDVVFVGESAARRTFDYVLRGSGLITAPIIALVR